MADNGIFLTRAGTVADFDMQAFTDVVKVVEAARAPLYNRLRHLTGAGPAAAWYEVVDVGDGGDVFYTEGGLPSDTKITRVLVSAPYRNMGYRVAVSGLADMASRRNPNERQTALIQAILNGTVYLKERIDNAMINADGTGDSFPGLITQIDAANGSFVLDAAAAQLTDTMLDTAMLESANRGYDVNIILCNPVQAKRISDIVLGAGNHQVVVVSNVNEQGNIVGAGHVSYYLNKATGKAAEVLIDPHVPADTVLLLPERLPANTGDARQGDLGLWWDELMPISPRKADIEADANGVLLATYAVLAFPARRGAAKIINLA